MGVLLVFQVVPVDMETPLDNIPWITPSVNISAFQFQNQCTWNFCQFGVSVVISHEIRMFAWQWL